LHQLSLAKPKTLKEAHNVVRANSTAQSSLIGPVYKKVLEKIYAKVEEALK